jgi:hypothetical protein
MHDNAPQAEDARMLRGVMLDNALETERLEVPLAAIAVKEVLA